MAGYTRQSSSSIASGQAVAAVPLNNEFNTLQASFDVSSGHSHDGSTGEGAPITTLFGNAISIGTNADTDIAITFNANSNDGTITWMEDEDYFKVDDDVLINSTEKIQFGDTASFIQQSSDGVLRVDGEATIDLNASTAVTVSNDLKLDSDSAVLGFGADNDTTLTHTDGSGLTLNDANKLMLRDSAISISSSSDGQLDLAADTAIQLTAPKIRVTNLIEFPDYGASGEAKITGGGSALTFSADDAINFKGSLVPLPFTHAGTGSNTINVSAKQSNFNYYTNFIDLSSGDLIITLASSGNDGEYLRIIIETDGSDIDGAHVATIAASQHLGTQSISMDSPGEMVEFIYSATRSDWILINSFGATLS